MNILLEVAVRLRQQRKVALIVACAMSFATSYLEASAAEEPWIADAKGCKAFNERPEPNESVTWTGECVNGLMEGNGEFQFFKNGVPGSRYTGPMRGGKFHGAGILVTRDGTRYEGQFDDNAFRSGTVTYIDGARYLGQVSGWQFHGRGTFMLPNGVVLSGEFQNGKLWNGTEDTGKELLQYRNGTALSSRPTTEPATQEPLRRQSESASDTSAQTSPAKKSKRKPAPVKVTPRADELKLALSQAQIVTAAEQALEGGRYGEVIALLEEAARHYPGDAKTWYLLASAQAALGKTDEGQRSYARAEELGLDVALRTAWREKQNFVYRRTLPADIKAKLSPALAQKLETDPMLAAPVYRFRATSSKVEVWVNENEATKPVVKVRSYAPADGGLSSISEVTRDASRLYWSGHRHFILGGLIEVHHLERHPNGNVAKENVLTRLEVKGRLFPARKGGRFELTYENTPLLAGGYKRELLATCQYGDEREASSLAPALTGHAIDLTCDVVGAQIATESNVRKDFRLTEKHVWLTDYGVFLMPQDLATRFSDVLTTDLEWLLLQSGVVLTVSAADGRPIEAPPAPLSLLDKRTLPREVKLALPATVVQMLEVDPTWKVPSVRLRGTTKFTYNEVKDGKANTQPGKKTYRPTGEGFLEEGERTFALGGLLAIHHRLGRGRIEVPTDVSLLGNVFPPMANQRFAITSNHSTLQNGESTGWPRLHVLNCAYGESMPAMTLRESLVGTAIVTTCDQLDVYLAAEGSKQLVGYYREPKRFYWLNDYGVFIQETELSKTPVRVTRRYWPKGLKNRQEEGQPHEYTVHTETVSFDTPK